jgi:hypothetical protein
MIPDFEKKMGKLVWALNLNTYLVGPEPSQIEFKDFKPFELCTYGDSNGLGGTWQLKFLGRVLVDNWEPLNFEHAREIAKRRYSQFITHLSKIPITSFDV